MAFLAGIISVITPCVLPLVPVYLSSISAIEAERLGKPGAARRVALASLPFIAGFTVVFVILGAAAAAIGGVLDSERQAELAGFVLVVLGLTFVGPIGVVLGLLWILAVGVALLVKPVRLFQAREATALARA